jgi:hypothetical protein
MRLVIGNSQNSDCDCDIRVPARRAGAVYDEAVLDQQVMRHWGER